MPPRLSHPRQANLKTRQPTPQDEEVVRQKAMIGDLAKRNEPAAGAGPCSPAGGEPPFGRAELADEPHPLALHEPPVRAADGGHGEGDRLLDGLR